MHYEPPFRNIELNKLRKHDKNEVLDLKSKESILDDRESNGFEFSDDPIERKA